jgi:hypothetical protein
MKDRVTYCKADGDHRHSWAVFVDGRMKWNGMSREEAKWRADKEKALLARRIPEDDPRDVSRKEVHR